MFSDITMGYIVRKTILAEFFDSARTEILLSKQPIRILLSDQTAGACMCRLICTIVVHITGFSHDLPHSVL